MEQPAKGRKCGANPRVVLDLASIEGNVEIDPDQHTLTGDVDAVQRSHWHWFASH